MKRTIAAIVAMSAACALFADDEAEATEESAVEASCELGEVDGHLSHILVAKTNAAPTKAFTTLPLCRRIEGVASVRKPGGEWERAEEGRFYPFGSSYRAEKGGALDVAFGSGSIATVADGSEFGTRTQEIGVKSRMIVLVNGTINLRLPDNLPEGMFFLTAPGFTIKNPAGVSVITYADKGDGDEATVLCKTGSLGIEGRHFDIPVMRAADEVKIRTSRDHLITTLYSSSGNYVVNLDQGMCTRQEFGDDGRQKDVVERGTLAWHLSPRTKVRIDRAVPAIGERMSVHTMTFDAAGALQNERSFTEGCAEVNSGELVAKKVKADGDELAKRAAEVTETTAATDTEDAPAEEAKAEKTTSTEEE